MEDPPTFTRLSLSLSSAASGSFLTLRPRIAPRRGRRSARRALRGILCGVAAMWLALASREADALEACGFIPFGTTWRAVDSPVEVTCDLQIAGLVIEPGVQVLFEGNHEVVVNGEIQSLGSQAQPITFAPAAANPSGWKGMTFVDVMPGSVFEWTRIRGANSTGMTLIRSAPELRNVTFDSNVGTHGGAIYVELLNDDLVLESTHFVDNFASVSGGAVYVVGDTEPSSPVFDVSDAVFLRNRAGAVASTRHNTQGGALYLDARVRLRRSIFMENTAEAFTIFAAGGRYARGGAIFVADGEIEIVASSFKANGCRLWADGFTPDPSRAYGGALFVANGDVQLRNVLVAENYLSATRHPVYLGSGLYVSAGSVSSTNATFVENTGHAAVHNVGGLVDVINGLLFFNNDDGSQISGAATVTYSTVQHGHAGVGNLGFNPVLGPDYAITLPSPAIDAGNPSPDYYDVFPPGLGTELNDMGFTGGGDAIPAPEPGGRVAALVGALAIAIGARRRSR